MSKKQVRGRFANTPVAVQFVPFTPGGTCLMHLASPTREKAIAALMEDAAHMPYKDWEAFEERGYTIEKVEF